MRTALTLRALPTLLTDCVLVGHAEKADVIFTPPQWFAMCAHMMNENPQNFFLMAYRDKDGKAKFARAYHANADDRIDWAWDTVKGTSKIPASIGFYPTNAQRQSRWGAMDFDSHDENKTRARDLAHKAFALLIREPKLYVALCTSAGDPVNTGWHLFIFTEDFYPVEEWTRLLKQVASQTETPVQSGVCEIFPDECKGIGRGIRAPGTWNPKNGECGLILRETFTKLLPSITPKESNASLGARCNTMEVKKITPSMIFRGERNEWQAAFSITTSRTRHDQLVKLIGTAFIQSGTQVAKQNAVLQHNEANPAPVATLSEHLAEFDVAWSGMERQWKAKLSPLERARFYERTTDNDRDAFRIMRNWSQTDSPDFKAHCQSLANRLGVTLKTAANIRRRFCALGILRKTAEYVPHKLASRYEWTANTKSKPEQSQLIVFPQWDGDPGDARLKRTRT
jgi:hypothetical protein